MVREASDLPVVGNAAGQEAGHTVKNVVSISVLPQRVIHRCTP